MQEPISLSPNFLLLGRVSITDTKLPVYVGYDDEDMLLPQSQQIPGLYNCILPVFKTTRHSWPAEQVSYWGELALQPCNCHVRQWRMGEIELSFSLQSSSA